MKKTVKKTVKRTGAPAMGPVWDLTPLYPDSAAWEKDFARIRPLAERFASYRGRLAESPEVLAEAIAAQDDFSRLAEKCYSFAHLRSDENTSDNANRARVDRLEGLFAELAPQESWFDPEVMAIDEAKMDAFLASPALAFYKRSLLELLRERKHILSTKEETLLGSLSEVLGSPNKIFEILNDSDLAFGRVKGEDGRPVEVTHGSYGRLVESPDREVRRRAFRKMYAAYRGKRNTFAATLDATVRRHVTMAKVRNYPSALAQALEPDRVPENVYRNLIASVHAGLPAFYDYMELRREVLGLKKLDMYDMLNPLIPECSREYSFDEAFDLVKTALAPMGEEYVANLELARSQRWIDAPSRKGKRSGAYSGGCYDSYPYLLLNHNGTLESVYTLAHELGHSLHSFYSNTHQPYHYADYEIFVAEVASTTNEILLSEYLLAHTDDPAFRRYLLSHIANDIRSTVYRQTMFAEFELMIHELSAQGEPLTADLLSEKYYALNKLYYGDAVEPDRDIELEWARIPHFYFNFYVYKYATSMSAALLLAQNILSCDPAKREAYFGFLKAGDSKDVLDIMRDAGVDLSRPEPVESAIAEFRRVVAQLRKEMGR